MMWGLLTRFAAGLGVILAMLGCTLDLSQKHDCRADEDCSPGHACFAGKCSDLDAAREIPNVVFVTSATTSSGFRSIDAADRICAAAAATAHLPGSFHAWLSTSTTDARDRLQGARGWVRPDGVPFADTVGDIVGGRIFNPLVLDEHGSQTSGIVVTGTTVDGRNDSAFDCSDWTTTGAGSAAAGTTDGTTGVWTSFTTIPCGAEARLYCFGVDHVATVAPPRPRGKLAFLSDDPFAVGGGLAAADAQCEREAAASGLTGTFRALLASPGANAWSRIPAGPGTIWSRVDGITLSSPGGSPLFDTAMMLAPLNVTSQKRYMDASVFTGAPGPDVPGDDTQTCGAWEGGSAATVGRANYMPWWFATGELQPCSSSTVAIYCFQSN